jgi:hypothetical protein
VGTLATIPGLTAGLCPAGRILRENGRKLYPGANPGVTQLLVGVYDDHTFTSGFIDPNSDIFAVFSGDKPYFVGNSSDPVSDLSQNGAPVYTNGLVYAGGELDISGDAFLHSDLRVTGDTLVEGILTVNGNTLLKSDLIVRGSIDLSGAFLVNSKSQVLTVNGTTSYAFASNLGVFYKFSMAPSAGSQTQTLAASSFLPANSIVYMEFINTTNNATTVAFGTGFNVVGSLSLAANGGSGTRAYTFGFICNGSSFSEISRSGVVNAF